MEEQAMEEQLPMSVVHERGPRRTRSSLLKIAAGLLSAGFVCALLGAHTLPESATQVQRRRLEFSAVRPTARTSPPHARAHHPFCLSLSLRLFLLSAPACHGIFRSVPCSVPMSARRSMTQTSPSSSTSPSYCTPSSASPSCATSTSVNRSRRSRRRYRSQTM